MFFSKKVTFRLVVRKKSLPLQGQIKKETKMNQSFIHILLCGIIILLAKVSGSGCCA